MKHNRMLKHVQQLKHCAFVGVVSKVPVLWLTSRSERSLHRGSSGEGCFGPLFPNETRQPCLVIVIIDIKAGVRGSAVHWQVAAMNNKGVKLFGRWARVAPVAHPPKAPLPIAGKSHSNHSQRECTQLAITFF